MNIVREQRSLNKKERKKSLSEGDLKSSRVPTSIFFFSDLKCPLDTDIHWYTDLKLVTFHSFKEYRMKIPTLCLHFHPRLRR